MAKKSIAEKSSAVLTITSDLFDALQEHLFPGDGDEHGAVIAAGLVKTDRGIRLVARELMLAREGVDYVPGRHGYRALTPSFIYQCVERCRAQGLVYLAVHNHPGTNSVAFSDIDLQSHERGYGALLDLTGGIPVGALVFARNAVAGDIWMSRETRLVLKEAQVIGVAMRHLRDKPDPSVIETESMYDRQLMLFGAGGQKILSRAKIGIIGLGGVGSLISQFLARLGVGHIVAADPKRISSTNLSRVVGANRADLQQSDGATPKVDIARRVAEEANEAIFYEPIFGDFSEQSVAERFLDCDFLFLAADEMKARLVFNAIVHQFLVPGIQLGAKVASTVRGEVDQAFSVTRWVLPTSGCLWCNGLIPRDLLAMEAKDSVAREEQTYGTRQENPSVITMNAICASHGVNDFLFSYLGLARSGASTDYLRHAHTTRECMRDAPRRDLDCPECGRQVGGRFALGQAKALPTFVI